MQQNCRELTLIECDWTVANLKSYLGPRAKLYVRPIQKDIPIEPIAKFGDSNAKAECNFCLQSYSTRELRTHIKTCILNEEHSDDSEELYNPSFTEDLASEHHLHEHEQIKRKSENTCKGSVAGHVEPDMSESVIQSSSKVACNTDSEVDLKYSHAQ